MLSTCRSTPRRGKPSCLGRREKVVADRGYKGDPRVVNPNDFDSDYHKKQMSNIRARHETVNGRIKKWECMSARFRNDRDKHHFVFRAVVVIEQLRIAHGRAPFQCELVSNPLIQWE